MSKFVKVPSSVTLKNSLGQVLVDDKGSPLVIEFSRFAQERVMDKSFTNGKTGFAAAILQSEALESIKNIPAPGDFWEIKSYEQWESFVRTVKETEFDPRFAFCFVPFMSAIIEAADSANLPQPTPATN